MVDLYRKISSFQCVLIYEDRVYDQILARNLPSFLLSCFPLNGEAEKNLGLGSISAFEERQLSIDFLFSDFGRNLLQLIRHY